MENEELENKLVEEAPVVENEAAAVEEKAEVPAAPEKVSADDKGEKKSSRHKHEDEDSEYDDKGDLTHLSARELKLIHKIERERSHRRGQSKASKFLNKLIILILLLGILACAGFFGYGYLFGNMKNEVKQETFHVEALIQYCQELVTVKYVYTDVDKFTPVLDAFPFSNKYVSHLILKYSGVIRAGVDLSTAVIEASEDMESVTITLEAPKILSNEISNYDVLDDDQKVFNKKVTFEGVFKKLEESKLATEERLAKDLLEDASKQAKLSIENMFLAAGFKNVEVIIPEIKRSPELDVGEEL